MKEVVQIIVRRCLVVIAITCVLVIVTTLRTPSETDHPAASPADKAGEDLTRIEYPSLKSIKWRSHFVLPHESLESMFGKEWAWVARFNRVDRRHVYPGMTIKVPVNMADARGYSPLPKFYEPAKKHDKYILLDITEQWIGAYENGKLVFSTPAATGKAGTETPTGMFRVTARHLTHTSSLYKTQDNEEQYPMDNALRFHVGDDNISYWIHARDLPGRPASHGCIGLYDEEMQNRVYGTPDKPRMLDSQTLYEWAAGEDEYGYDDGSIDELEDGPVVEIRGNLPATSATPIQH